MHPSSTNSPGGRYSHELRELAVRHLADVRNGGGKISQAARDLGVDANTLRTWEAEERGRVVP